MSTNDSNSINNSNNIASNNAIVSQEEYDMNPNPIAPELGYIFDICSYFT